jgi:hypothetical protein
MTASQRHASRPPDSPATQATLGSLLADETRIRILRALYAVQSEETDCDGLPFSTLRRRADVTDSGRFNYHLNQLSGKLVTKRDGRYVLTPTGQRLVRALDGSDDQPEDGVAGS